MLKRITFLVLLLIVFLPHTRLLAQSQVDPIEVACGTIIDGEVTADLKGIGVYYSIELSPGDTVSFEIVPYANTFTSYIGIHDPSGSRIAWQDAPRGQTNSFEVAIPATGKYLILIAGRGFGYIGAYTMYISCTLRPGTIIEAGAEATPIVSDPPPNSDCTGFCFPGLPAVNFGNVARVPLVVGSPFNGAVTPTGSEIIGYSFDVTAGQIIQLDFNRLAGNLNLGVVVLTQEGYVAFQASLISSSTLMTKFPALIGGNYTVGIFRIDVSPPGTPEATSFSINVTLPPQ